LAIHSVIAGSEKLLLKRKQYPPRYPFGVLVRVEGVEPAAEAGLEMCQPGVDPAELGTSMSTAQTGSRCAIAHEPTA
jgi:hypothetical protein